MADLTVITVNIARHETCTYELEGAYSEEAALEAIGSGEYDPAHSKIRSEDIDVVRMEVTRG